MVLMTLRRRRYKVELDPGDPYLGEGPEEVLKPDSWGNLVGSRIDGTTLHAPALDIDAPCHLVSSKTPGHHHLYIDVPMTWRKYRVLLWTLRWAGILDDGFYRMSVHRRQTFLRSTLSEGSGCIRCGLSLDVPPQMGGCARLTCPMSLRELGAELGWPPLPDEG